MHREPGNPNTFLYQIIKNYIQTSEGKTAFATPGIFLGPRNHYSCMLNQVVKLNANKCDCCVYMENSTLLFCMFFFNFIILQVFQNCGNPQNKTKITGDLHSNTVVRAIKPLPTSTRLGLATPLASKFGQINGSGVFREKI